jgi:L-fuculose-phosphate aldolase
MIMSDNALKHVDSRDRLLIETTVRDTVAEWVKNRQPAPVTLDKGLIELVESPSVKELGHEIVRTGQKLWQRQYVDGNGGNISARIGDRYVLCTPTLLSKGDLRAGDLAIVDLDNKRVCGNRAHTSEILLHLEIYKTVPEAKAVIHCHPPYATAYALAGMVPPGNLIPEQEVFVGPVALAPYETPGTLAFAKTIRRFAKDHNTVLLANHGVVCWADTVTHAEWYVEIVDTYCKTIQIAAQLNPKLTEIPREKITELLAVKRRLGMSLPDARSSTQETPREPGASITASVNGASSTQVGYQTCDPDGSQLVHLLTERLVALFGKGR